MKKPSEPNTTSENIRIQEGKYPVNPREKLIKVCVGQAIGYVQTEKETIQMIEKLRNW